MGKEYTLNIKSNTSNNTTNSNDVSSKSIDALNKALSANFDTLAKEIRSAVEPVIKASSSSKSVDIDFDKLFSDFLRNLKSEFNKSMDSPSPYYPQKSLQGNISKSLAAAMQANISDYESVLSANNSKFAEVAHKAISNAINSSVETAFKPVLVEMTKIINKELGTRIQYSKSEGTPEEIVGLVKTLITKLSDTKYEGKDFDSIIRKLDGIVKAIAPIADIPKDSKTAKGVGQSINISGIDKLSIGIKEIERVLDTLKKEAKVTIYAEADESSIRKTNKKIKDGVGANKANEVVIDVKTDVNEAKKGLNEISKQAEETQKKVAKAQQEASKQKAEASKQKQQQQKQIDDLNKQKTTGQLLNNRRPGPSPSVTSTITAYTPGVVTPSETKKLDDKVSNVKSKFKGKEELERATKENINAIKKSLYDLQKRITDELESGFEKKQAGKWGVVTDSSGQGFSLAGGKSRWTLDIANLQKLRSETKLKSNDAGALVKAFKSDVIADTMGSNDKAGLIGKWLKTVSASQLKEQVGDKTQSEKLIGIKKAVTGKAVGPEIRKMITDTFGEKEGLENIFAKTYAESKARKALIDKKLVRTLSVPAAQIAETGEVSFQTTHGSKRALPKFATFKTGYEQIYEGLEKGGSENAGKFGRAISKMPMRARNASERKEANQLAKDMLRDYVSVVKGNDLTDLKKVYKEKAVSQKKIEFEKMGFGDEYLKEFESKVDSAIKGFDSLASNKQTFDEFVNTMDKLNLKASDVMKGLNTLDVKNVYDVMGDVLTAGGDKSPIASITSSPYFDRSAREFDKAISNIEGLMPIVESNRPRRAFHQESLMNTMVRTSPVFQKANLNPSNQKRLVKDLNLEISDTIDRINKFAPEEKKLPIRRASSLGLPDSTAGNVEEYRPSAKGGAQYLKPLNATSVKLYTEDLAEQAAFSNFQIPNRNVSFVSSAMAGPGDDLTTPRIRSEKERALVESSRFGEAKGYGYNVVAELQTTAETFEDQIVIAGKLANAMTSAVKILVKPSSGGRVSGGADEAARNTGTTDIEAGQVLVDNIEDASREFMKILGVPEEYKGRADKALIEDVKKTIASVRGESVEVQQAKLAETFMTYFGRKLATRYGYKGVSVTAGRQGSDFLKEIEPYMKASKFSVDPSATLGYQLAPKSMGELASELLKEEKYGKSKKKVSEEDQAFYDSLKSSGNKFMLSMMRDTNIVSGDEAAQTTKLAENFSDQWQKVFKEAAPGVDEKGILALKDKYVKTIGGGDTSSLTKPRAVDVRINAANAGKRGLQNEFLEVIASNVTGGTSPTTFKDLSKKDYDELLTKGKLSSISKALGYQKATPASEEKVAKQLFKAYGGKGKYKEALNADPSSIKDEDEAFKVEENKKKALMAQKAAALEAASNFYSTIVDEFGQKRTGFIGNKFLEIVEEPTLNPEWSKGQIDKGLKGARLNLPAFASYSAIFGKDSKLMEEIQGDLDVGSGKNLEILKAIQSMQPEGSSIRQKLMSGLETVDLSTLRSFDASTGVNAPRQITDSEGNIIENDRSFQDTILDFDKHPGSFKLKLPTGRMPEGEMQTEDFYVPGSSARAVYPEPLLAGEYGLSDISRRLTNVVNFGKDLEKLLKTPKEDMDISEEDITKKVSSLSSESWDLAKEAKALNKDKKYSGSERATVIEKRQRDILGINEQGQFTGKGLVQGLDKFKAPDPNLIDTKGLSELEHLTNIYSEELAKVKQGSKTMAEGLARTIGVANDMLVGPKKREGNQIGAQTALSRSGSPIKFAESMGMDPVQDKIDNTIRSLQKAKQDYYNSLANSVVGKKGSVNEIFFTRKVPSVIAKAVTGVVDKRKDLDTFSSKLQDLESKYADYGLDFSKEVKGIGKVKKEHGTTIEKLEETGMPVMKQDEIGIPEEMAKKIQVSFKKKFRLNKKSGELEGITSGRAKPEDSNLYDMLEYSKSIKEASKGTNFEDAVSEHIQKDLKPFVESIRYPFTGASSIAPFSPKLLGDDDYVGYDGRNLAANSVIVPGVPKGLGGLSEVITPLQTKLDELVKRRDTRRDEGAPDDELERLSGLIRELNAAISDIIPKYVSQAQKLDFDGDQIEIHSAKTIAARAEIEKHKKSFHSALSPDKTTFRTQDMFMQRFLSEAAEVTDTGPYVLASGMQKFDKNTGADVDFLRTPFKSDNFEHLTDPQALRALESGNTKPDVINNIKDIMSEVGISDADISKMSTELEQLDFGAKEEDLFNNIISTIQKSAGDESYKLIAGNIRKRVGERKSDEALEANLFKIHTGTETESMYRLHMLAQQASSFGKGFLGTGNEGLEPSDYFKKRFPKEAFGGVPEEEYNSMMNEFLRFGVQKGIDVKKETGGKPVAGVMVDLLRQGLPGAESLWEQISDKKNDTFADLRKFAGDSEKAIRYRLGEKSTTDIKGEAKTLLESRGESTEDLDSMDRKELVQLMVDKTGFKGFLEETALLIKEEAVKGMIANFKKEGKYQDKDDLALRQIALKEVNKSISEGKGVDIRGLITENQAPLYSSRTFFSSPQSELEKHEKLYGDVIAPTEEFDKMTPAEQKRYMEKYKGSSATAVNIQTELKSFEGTPGSSAYSTMIRGASEQLLKRQEEIEGYANKMAGYSPAPLEIEDIMGEVTDLSESKLPDFIKDIVGKVGSKDKGRKATKEIARLSDLTGVAASDEATDKQLYDELLPDFAEIARGMGESDEVVAELADKWAKRAVALKQLNKIMLAIKSKASEGDVLREMLPGGSVLSPQDYKEAKSKVITEKKKELNEAKRRARETMFASTGNQAPTGPPAPGQQPPSGGPAVPNTLMPNYSGVMPVHLVAADDGAVVTVRTLEGAGFVPSSSVYNNLGPGMEAKSDSIYDYSSDSAKLRELLKRAKHDEGEIVSSKDYFTPSRLGKGESSELLKELRFSGGSKDDGTPRTDLGTAIHARLQKKLMDDMNNIATEVYKEKEIKIPGIPQSSTLGGVADILEFEDPESAKTRDMSKLSKVVDIKTAEPDMIKEIQRVIDDVGSNRYEDIIDQLNEKTRDKIEGYFNQVNAYIKIFNEKAEGEINFYDLNDLGRNTTPGASINFDFDKKSFERNMAALEGTRQNMMANEPDTPFSTIIKKVPKTDQDDFTDAELEDLVNLAYKAYRDQKGPGNRISTPRQPGKAGKFSEVRNTVESYSDKVSSTLSPEEQLNYVTSTGIEPGFGSDAQFKNIKRLHEQSKIFQKKEYQVNASFAGLPKHVKDPLKDIIDEVKDTGNIKTANKKFIETTDKLQEMYGEDFSFNDNIKAWKMYKMAVGDFYIKEAQKAYDELTQIKEAGEDTTAAEDKLYAAVGAMQGFVRRNLGKKTDIYAPNNRFVNDQLAAGAGVYQSPGEIMQNAKGPLGDDQVLSDMLDDIIKYMNTGEGLTSGKMFAGLSDMNENLVDLLANAEKFGALGPELSNAWDFDKMAERATRLRAALEKMRKQTVGAIEPEQTKYLDIALKKAKQLEATYSSINFRADSNAIGLVPVDKQAPIDIQKALNARNLQATNDYFRNRPAAKGGPEIGQRFSYTEKVLGPTGEVMKNVVHNFVKYDEVLNKAGASVGKFNHYQNDLIEKMQTSNSSFKNAIRRVVMWGAASRLVYGGISYLNKSIDEISDIEVAMAQLRMVMNPLETDFNRLGKAAIGYAKEYGVSVGNILQSMRVFAQQGLSQAEIIDRTRTATLAANVSTLNAKDATEALTAAMKIFKSEGDQSIRFLDAWSEVESKHAITAEDMANAIKKSAAAAKTAGVTFDQLNGIVAAIGSTTRQTGKEVGTSLRFIFRRLNSDKGPKTLAGLKEPIPTLTREGELRPGFDVLSDLANQWKDLTSAQKLNVAQSIGGTRQYNSLLVLMDQWDEALRAIKNSENSKGSAERRNQVIMETYAKQMEQTKAAATELKMELGKIVLPSFKGGLKAMKLFLETINNIPTSIKIAGSGLLLFLGTLSKGLPIINSIVETFDKGKSIFSGFGRSLSKELKTANFEIFGKGNGGDLLNLKTVTKEAAEKAKMGRGITDENKDKYMFVPEAGDNINDFNSALGKTAHLAYKIGMSFNEIVKATRSIESSGKAVGSSLTSLGDKLTVTDDVYSLLTGEATKEGLTEAAGTQAVRGGIKTLAPFLGKLFGVGSEVAGYGAMASGQLIEGSSKFVGETGEKLIKKFASEDTGLKEALGPLVATTIALLPAIKGMYKEFSKMSATAQDFDKSMANARRSTDDRLKSTRSMISEYKRLTKEAKEIEKLRDPKVKERRLSLETYESPLFKTQKLREDMVALNNRVAESNINLVAGVTDFGDAILKTSGDMETYLKVMERADILSNLNLNVDVMDKFVDELNGEVKGEKFKKIFKDLAESFPVVGEMISEQIHISPASLLAEATKDLNSKLALKNKYPMSKVLEEELNKSMAVLSKAKATFKDEFQPDFERMYKSVVAPGTLKGLTDSDILKHLTSDKLKRAYEARLNIEINPMIREKLSVGDIMGKEVLSALNPKVSGFLGVNKDVTQALFEQAQVASRDLSGGTVKTYEGDIVTFQDELAKKMAGGQGIVRLKETDGQFQAFVEYFDKTTKKVETLALDSISNMIDGIFPLGEIDKEIADRINILNTTVTGAAAGLVGIDKKNFKKEFSLGERYFSQIPTTTLLQGSFGFNPVSGYGQMPFAKNSMLSGKNAKQVTGWADQMQEFYFEPMKKLKTQIESAQMVKRGAEDRPLKPLDTEAITKSLDILKNNQAVFQFRAVFVDLMKEFAEGNRVLEETLSIQRQRVKTDIETKGLMSGVPKSLMSLDMGVTKASDLSTHQKLLIESPGYRDRVSDVNTLDTLEKYSQGVIDALVKGQVDIKEIMKLSESQDIVFNQDRLLKEIEPVLKTQDKPFAQLKDINKVTAENTGKMTELLDINNELTKEQLALSGKSPEREKELKEKNEAKALKDKFDSLANATNPSTIAKNLETAAEMRKRARKDKDYTSVATADRTITKLVNNLVEKAGSPSKAYNMIRGNKSRWQDFTPEDFAAVYGSGIMGTTNKDIYGGLTTEGVQEKGRFPYGFLGFGRKGKNVTKLQDDEAYIDYINSLDRKETIGGGMFSVDNMAKIQAAVAAASIVGQRSNTKELNRLQGRLQDEKARLGNNPDSEEFNRINQNIVKLEGDIASEKKNADFYKMAASVSGAGFVANQMGQAFGLDERLIKLLNVGALGSLGAVEFLSLPPEVLDLKSLMKLPKNIKIN